MSKLTLIAKYSGRTATIRAEMGDEHNPILISRRQARMARARACLATDDYWIAAVDPSGLRCPVFVE